MKLLTSLAGGLAGAITVTILHKLARSVDRSAPRLANLGHQAAPLIGGVIGMGVTRWLENRNKHRTVKVSTSKTPDQAYKPVLDITV
jgi:hypothetical protein